LAYLCSDYIKTPAGLDLAEALLAFDPRRRPTAKAALEYPYFTEEEPMPEKPTWLADIQGDWHEMESKEASRKKGREMRKAQQHTKEATAKPAR
jgi:CTD kinase subunit alpha